MKIKLRLFSVIIFMTSKDRSEEHEFNPTLVSRLFAKNINHFEELSIHRCFDSLGVS